MKSSVPLRSFILRISNATIRNKIALIIRAVLLGSMVIIFVSNAWLTIHNSLRDAREGLLTLADAAGHNLEGPLIFKDGKGVQEVLHSLHVSSSIVHAEVRNTSNHVLAQYSTERPETKVSNLTQLLPVQHYLVISRPITMGEQALGTLTLQASLNAMWESQLNLLMQMAAVVGSALLIAAFLTKRLSAVVVDPIQQIASTARRITRGGDYTLRVNKVSDDEVGLLADEFNNMLYEINQRDHALREAETKLKTLVRTLPDLVWLKDANGLYLLCNPRFERLFGAPEKDIVGKTDYDFVDKELADFFRANDRIAIAKGGPSVNEEWVTFADGHRELLETTKTPMFDAHDHLIGVLGIGHDITARKLVENELRISAIAFESQEGMLVTDANNAILRVNRAFTNITGYTAEEVIGKNPRLLKSGHQDRNFYAEMWAKINHTGVWEGEIWNRHKSGKVHPEWLTITSVHGTDGTVTNYVATLTDITHRKEAAEKINQLAFYDSLTHLPNRRLLMDRLHQAISACERNLGRGALLFIDLDNFKNLNDTLGHDIGDMLLSQAAQRLASCVRKCDTVARFGGDEFVVMLEDLSGQPLEAAAQTETIGEKILATLNQPYHLATIEHSGTASIGATIFSGNQLSIDEIFKQADIAMYQAKKSGRNALCFFDPQMQASINARVELEADLRLALAENQFELYYQLQAYHNRQAVGAEILIRWQHPKYGLVSPVDFIPVAEEIGLILPIGQWVLEAACAQIKAWEDSMHTRHLQLSVNVSARQFYQPDFVDQVRQVLRLSAINPDRLKLEITESLVLDDIDDTVIKMKALREIGVRFSLDDFGTGYSSLAYLTQLPLDQLKIDRSFVRNISVKPSDSVIVQTIIGMANNLGIEVIAEGVETETQRAFLEEHGCSLCQGYLFSKPVPLAEFEQLLKRSRTLSDEDVLA